MTQRLAWDPSDGWRLTLEPSLTLPVLDLRAARDAEVAAAGLGLARSQAEQDLAARRADVASRSSVAAASARALRRLESASAALARRAPAWWLRGTRELPRNPLEAEAVAAYLDVATGIASLEGQLRSAQAALARDTGLPMQALEPPDPDRLAAWARRRLPPPGRCLAGAPQLRDVRLERALDVANTAAEAGPDLSLDVALHGTLATDAGPDARVSLRLRLAPPASWNLAGGLSLQASGSEASEALSLSWPPPSGGIDAAPTASSADLRARAEASILSAYDDVRAADLAAAAAAARSQPATVPQDSEAGAWIDYLTAVQDEARIVLSQLDATLTRIEALRLCGAFEGTDVSGGDGPRTDDPAFEVPGADPSGTDVSGAYDSGAAVPGADVSGAHASRADAEGGDVAVHRAQHVDARAPLTAAGGRRSTP